MPRMSKAMKKEMAFLLMIKAGLLITTCAENVSMIASKVSGL